MRAAAVAGLSATSLHRIESTWGLNTRDLVLGTRVALVDEVLT